ncbi:MULTISPECIES: precorrin-4 C(11)-methyltransferase [Nocardia]|uniref:precorrin-4 C(11)-methyltransferase n=1 Tax=Nocardia TaxID=1817 RepID=UPI0007EAC3E5|nr:MULTISPECIES: precorrin-4 C(11)-methyltransferase [Nocardia]MBF6274032.1 precorrin-4 C(11)-methyltransferase [Nocardia nova]OBA46374.1 precorrin-4 C(11)-methyltransferase [Nocardia sp. 852002-51101_SCH5132738]OBB45756.1 precorrin-4 C(11)-methyltransferase [Nocardia sp. 852002-51244_SCH5132740]OBF68543.1 precorrin-4 C(11)-methyltransferase [Mycobacterium sp. 852002-51759_SCH5129042]
MTVHFIGAGPGAADLLTLRAVALLRESPVCLYAGTYLDPEVLAHCAPEAELIDTQGLDLDEIVAHCVRADAEGKDVARLCSGDPSIYSALTEQARRLDGLGIAWDVTPGVPAYAAAAAVLGSELTVPEVVQSVVLTRTRARSTAMPESEALANFARTRASLVLHLAITRIRELAAELAQEYGADCPAVVVYRASQPQQRILRGTLADIAGQVEAAGLRQAAVVLVGRALTPALDCAQSHLYDPGRERHPVSGPGA